MPWFTPGLSCIQINPDLVMLIYIRYVYKLWIQKKLIDIFFININLSHTHTYTHTYTRTHTITQTHTHRHTHTYKFTY